jgi:predicted transposase/invertase (TIGR01784 family)
MVLQIPIGRLQISKERCIVYNPEYKGVRLDVFARDEAQTCYNVEMQVQKEPEPGKRSRYYHSQIDMELLQAGAAYSTLPGSYVIFICDYDPFGRGKYRYTFEMRCRESPEAALQDGTQTIFLSTRGNSPAEVPQELIRFLEFVRTDSPGNRKNYQDAYVKSLQAEIRLIKKSRHMEAKYMLLELELKKERQEGKAEGLAQGLAQGLSQGLTQGLAQGKAESILDFLNRFGSVPESLQQRILSEQNLEVLSHWVKLASKAQSIEDFLNRIQ